MQDEERHTMRKTILGLAVITAIASALAWSRRRPWPSPGPYTTDFTGVTIDKTPRRRRQLADDRWLRRRDHRRRDDPALRISNAVTSGSFGDQLFSPTLDVPATETGPAHTFTASFVLEPVAASAGPAGDGQPRQRPGRPGRLPRDRAHERRHQPGQPGVVPRRQAGELEWAVTTVATGLDPSKPHTVKLKLVKKPDTKKSTNNDVFSVQVDGKPVKNTTFEAYYEATGEDELPDRHADVPPQRHRAAAARRQRAC